MPTELECKIAVDRHDEVRERLRALGAKGGTRVLETNRLFDRDGELLRRDCALRVRIKSTLGDDRTAPTVPEGPVEGVLTFKGPARPGGLKNREEIEISIDDSAGMISLLQALGYGVYLEFEKRRESWTLGGCDVELDELPEIGHFVEVEGPGEDVIADVVRQIGLDIRQSMTTGYPALVARHVGGDGPYVLRFA